MHKEILLFIIYLVELFGEVGLSKNTKQFAFFLCRGKSSKTAVKTCQMTRSLVKRGAH
jgi:hypothetical protein